MATAAVLRRTYQAVNTSNVKALKSSLRQLPRIASAGKYLPDYNNFPSSCFNFSSQAKTTEDYDDDAIFVKNPAKKNSSASHSDSMPLSFMTGSIVGKRFYNEVGTRKADDGNGWTVMLDYRTLKTPSKKPLKCPTLSLAKAIAAEWEFQQKDGIRPFTMPLMKLACTAMERVPVTRPKIIEYLITKLHQDLVFCRSPGDNDINSKLLELQVKKLDPLLIWLESKFGYKPVVYTSFFGGKQEEGLVRAVESFLKKTDDCELAAIDAIASAAHSLVVAIGVCSGRLSIEESIELIRLEEDMQVDRWGLVEGGHDVDIADLQVQVSSAAFSWAYEAYMNFLSNVKYFMGINELDESHLSILLPCNARCMPIPVPHLYRVCNSLKYML